MLLALTTYTYTCHVFCFKFCQWVMQAFWWLIFNMFVSASQSTHDSLWLIPSTNLLGSNWLSKILKLGVWKCFHQDKLRLITFWSMQYKHTWSVILAWEVAYDNIWARCGVTWTFPTCIAILRLFRRSLMLIFKKRWGRFCNTF